MKDSNKSRRYHNGEELGEKAGGQIYDNHSSGPLPLPLGLGIGDWLASFDEEGSHNGGKNASLDERPIINILSAETRRR